MGRAYHKSTLIGTDNPNSQHNGSLNKRWYVSIPIQALRLVALPQLYYSEVLFAGFDPISEKPRCDTRTICPSLVTILYPGIWHILVLRENSLCVFFRKLSRNWQCQYCAGSEKGGDYS